MRLEGPGCTAPPAAARRSVLRAIAARPAALLALPVVLALLAVNPWVLPDTADAIVYLVGAQSLLEHGVVAFGGWRIWDWPPGFSVLLAVPMALGFDPVVTSKVTCAVCFGVAVWLSWRLLRAEGRPHPVAVAVVAALLPASFLLAIRVMSEYAYMAVSLLFLHRLLAMDKDRRRLSEVLLAGALLGAAALTRQVGVTLGAAVVLQIVTRLRARASREGLVRPVLGELVVGATGAALYLGWKAVMLPALEAKAAWSNHSDQPGILRHFDLLAFSEQLGNLATQGLAVARTFGLSPGFVTAAGLVVLALMIVGLVDRARSGDHRPSDAYLAAACVLYLFMLWKLSRYLVPLAPLILSAALRGVEVVLRPFKAGIAAWRRRGALLTLFAWGTVALAMDGWLLMAGNGETHGALLYPRSQTAESFYRGEWLDLYRACDAIRREVPEGSVLLVGRYDVKYPAWFCRRPIVLPPKPSEPEERICNAPPYRIPEGLHLFMGDGVTRPLPFDARSTPRPTSRCYLRAVLADGEKLEPGMMPATVTAHRAGSFGQMTVYDLDRRARTASGPEL